MSQVITAKSAGFCFGVNRAVEIVYEEIEKGEPVYTYGPIIHNEEAVADLERKGVHVIMSDDELARIFTAARSLQGPTVFPGRKKRSSGRQAPNARMPHVLS